MFWPLLFWPLLFWLGLIGLLLALGVGAQEATPQDPDEEPDWGVGEDFLDEGKYRKALDAYRGALKTDPGSRADRYGLALTLLETGGYGEARTLLEGLVAEFPKNRAYRLKLGQVLFLTGQLDPAEKQFRSVLEARKDDFEAHARLGRLLAWRGRPDEAERHFKVPERVAAERVVRKPEALLYLGWCYWGLKRLGEASKVFLEALQDEEYGDPMLYPAYASLMALYLENHHVYGPNPPYMPLREEAFRHNPNHADIHRVLADIYLARMEHPRCLEALKKTLDVNPNLVHGLCLKAYFALDKMDFEGAKKILLKARSVNPVDKEVGSYLASLHYILGDTRAAEAEWKRVLALDPHYGQTYNIVSELLGNLRRYEEAHEFARRATRVDARLWKAWDNLGRFALHIGKEKEALEALRQARDGDPFGDKHPWRHNMLELFGQMDEFIVHAWGPFHLRIHSEDNPILKRYLKKTLDEALKDLSRKYGFTPRGPIRVEVFSRQEDFAVRTVGVPGIYGVLGACFGQVITMNSPRALPLGSYVWKATLWHEFAHVITLQMSNYRVSRWLTEGLSVYEEKCRNPAWEEVEDEQLHNALANDALVSVKDLDGLFRSSRIRFAYLQSLHLVEFLIGKKGGFKKILEMLTSYAAGNTTRQVLEGVLGMAPADLDRAFAAYLRERFAGQHIQPFYSREAYENARETLALEPGNLKALRVVGWYHFQQGSDKVVDCEAALGRLLARSPKDPSGLALRGELALRKRKTDRATKYLEKARHLGRDEFYLRLNLARLAQSRGDVDSAIVHLKAAKKLFPRFVEKGNPYLELARLHGQKGEKEAARQEIEAFVRLEARDVRHRLELADHLIQEGMFSRALPFLREANQVVPFVPRIHERLARALSGIGKHDEALDEIDLAILLTEEIVPAKRPKKSKLPDLRLERAKILRTMGRHEEAEAEARAALEDHPDHTGLTKFLRGGTATKGK